MRLGVCNLLGIGLAVVLSAAAARAQSTAPTPAPLPARTATITDFGAVSDGTTINTVAIQKAIDSLAQQGGGTLIIPADTKMAGATAADATTATAAGTFLSGALFLKPRINLHLEKGAILKGSTDIKDYPLTRTRIEGHFQDWTPALINAIETDNLRIDGAGTLDGSGTPFYAAFRSARGAKNLDVPRPRLLFISKANTVSVSGIHLLNSGFWNLHLYNCQNVTIDGLDIRAPAGSPSTDGIDIDSCQWVAVKNTFISNNDDCIALKGTKGVDAADDKDSPPVEHIRVSNCTFAMGASLVTCGSEATVVRDVRVEHCTVAGPESRGINVLRLKLRTDTPQFYEDIHFDDITLDGVGTLISIAPWNQYETIPPGRERPSHIVRNISLTNIHGTFGTFGAIRPNPGDTIEKINLENIDLRFTVNATPNLSAVKELTVKNIIVNGKEYQPPAMTEPMQTGTSPQTRP